MKINASTRLQASHLVQAATSKDVALLVDRLERLFGPVKDKHESDHASTVSWGSAKVGNIQFQSLDLVLSFGKLELHGIMFSVDDDDDIESLEVYGRTAGEFVRKAQAALKEQAEKKKLIAVSVARSAESYNKLAEAFGAAFQ